METEPVETEPVETEPVETEPVETEPVETEPVETEPVETEPVETEPVETEPVETEPVETEPAETEPTEPEPTEPEVTEPEDEPDEPDEEVDLPFTDVPENAWFRKPVEFVYENGYMSGMSATSFGPKTSVTRGMMVTVLYRIAGSPEVSSSARKHFSDTQGKYYTDAVGWAWDNDLVTGMGNNQFGPNYKLTRQDAMTIFYRYCVYHLGMDGTCTGDLSDFADAHRVSSYAELPVSWAVDVGLMSGLADGNKLLLNPRGYLTRAEAATVLRALVTNILEID